MKKILRNLFEIGFVGVLFLLTSFNIFGQPTIIEPGDKSINSALINTGNFTWDEYKFGKEKRLISVTRNNQEITIVKKRFDKGVEVFTETTVLNAKTLETIRQTYTDENFSSDVQFGAKIKGTKTISATKKKELLNEEVTEKAFEVDALDFVISSLPLSLDYRVTLPAFGINTSFKPFYEKYRISNIQESKFYSCVTGNREVWIVTVEPKYNAYTLYIDKATRRILRKESVGKNSYKDTESDINPIKTPFNAAEAKAMITGGTATIQGQAWTRAGLPSGSGIFNGNKKQYAPKGTIVALIPITPYFKELYEFNLRNLQNYNNCGLTKASPEAEKATLVTDVIDDKGNFVFKNLKPGEYWVSTTFVATKYSHTTKTPDGYLISVTGEGTAYATQTYDVKHWGDKGDFASFKSVKVNKEGETVKLKLDN